MASGDLDLALLAGAGVLLVAIGGVRASSRLGVPSLLLYLGIGLVLGEGVIGLRFDDTLLARDLGLVALALILAEGGLTTRWHDLRVARLHHGQGGGLTLAAFFERIDALGEQLDDDDERGQDILGALYDHAEQIAP